MIDFHTHSLLSDGELVPSELARRAQARGYRALGIAEHVDGSNADLVIPRLVEVCRELSDLMDIDVVAGAEITHVPPSQLGTIVQRCKALGAEYLMIHGETLSEPVCGGTNAEALRLDIDILAHPGLLSLDQAKQAASRGIYLELSARKGNCLGNGLVARMALAAGAKLIVGSDAHGPADLITVAEAERIARGAGLSDRDVKKLRRNAECLLRAILARRARNRR